MSRPDAGRPDASPGGIVVPADGPRPQTGPQRSIPERASRREPGEAIGLEGAPGTDQSWGGRAANDDPPGRWFDREERERLRALVVTLGNGAIFQPGARP